MITIDRANFEGAALLAFTVAILGQTLEQPEYLNGIHIVALQPGLQCGVELGKVDVLPFTIFCIWREFRQQLEQCLFKFQRLHEPLIG
ncbi:hypothetical protein D3C72_2362690 [compost metagenome]